MYETATVTQPPRSAWTVALAGLGAFMTALDVMGPTDRSNSRNLAMATRCTCMWATAG